MSALSWGGLLTIFTMGLLSSAHCVGMCGGFAAAIGATRGDLMPLLARHLTYSAGRVTTYAFLGACGGYAGAWLSRLGSAMVTAQQVFSMVAGVIMMLVAASVLGLLPIRRITQSSLGLLLAPMFRHFLNARSSGELFVAGLANGFLPCGLVYAFLAMAIGNGTLAGGAAIMIAFGLGTVPAMTAVGCGSLVLSHATRLRVYRVAACFVLMAGGATIWRAWPTRDAPCCAHEPLTVATSP